MLAVAAGAMALAGCDDYDDRYTPEYASVVRLDKSGEEAVTVWSTAPETGIDVKILRSGHNIAQSTNAIFRKMTSEEWEEYAATYGMRNYNVMPDACVSYNGEAGSKQAVVPFAAGQISGELTVELIAAEVKAFQEKIETTETASDVMVLPLVLTTDNGSVLEESSSLILNVSYKSPVLSMSHAGFEKAYCSASSDAYVREISISLEPEDNPAGFTVRLSNSQSLLDKYNAANGTAYELVKPGALEYSLDGESWSDWADMTLDFPAGTTEKSLSVRMNPSKLLPMDAMALELTDLTINAEVPADRSASIFAVAVKPANVKIAAANVSANNDDGTHKIKNLFDGRVTSFYRSANTPHDGDPVYGSYVDIKLPSAMTYFAFDLTSAASSYSAAGNPNEVHIYGSTDGVNWEKFAEITDMQQEFTGAGKTASFGNFCAPKAVSHIRWAVIKAGSTGDADLREANTSAFWAATHLKVYGK